MSSPGVTTFIPTVGTLTLPFVAASGLLSLRPIANGTHGFFYTVDEGKLYFDLGLGIIGTPGYAAQWVQIFSGGPTGA